MLIRSLYNLLITNFSFDLEAFDVSGSRACPRAYLELY